MYILHGRDNWGAGEHILEGGTPQYFVEHRITLEEKILPNTLYQFIFDMGEVSK